MGMFGFDDQYAMFDTTPLDNQFILEYMPTAKGDYVKVYLYGLLHCYHPVDGMCVTQIAKALALTDDEVLQAYRYWERRGLVRRVSDKPPCFRYVSVKQQFFMGTAAEQDPAYESFAESIHALFGNERRIHGKDMNLCYEWVEDLGLPPEVVIMLVQHMISIRGKNFSFAAAQKLAVSLAEQQARTVDDAAMILGRDKKVWDGSRKLLRRMGKRREPSEDEMNLYLKWLRDWGYSPDAIDAACAETTKGEPTFAYLDGILRGMMQRQGKALTSKGEVEQLRSSERDRIAPLKEIFAALKSREIINEGTLAVYQEMRDMYPHSIIMIAARECARYSGNLEDVMRVLGNWQRQNLTTTAQIESYMARVNQLNDLLSALYQVWGVKTRTNAPDRALLQKWLEAYGFSKDFILFSAGLVQGADKPMLYLNSMLESFHQKGIRTEQAAANEHQSHREQYQASAKTARGGKQVKEQQYEQRDYTPSDDLPDWMAADIEEMNKHGG